MKDILTEVMKLEVKIMCLNALQDYYKGKITFLQYQEEVSKSSSACKAILEEADVKPSYRSELESHSYPLQWFFTRKSDMK